MDIVPLAVETRVLNATSALVLAALMATTVLSLPLGDNSLKDLMRRVAETALGALALGLLTRRLELACLLVSLRANVPDVRIGTLLATPGVLSVDRVECHPDQRSGLELGEIRGRDQLLPLSLTPLVFNAVLGPAREMHTDRLLVLLDVATERASGVRAIDHQDHEHARLRVVGFDHG